LAIGDWRLAIGDWRLAIWIPFNRQSIQQSAIGNRQSAIEISNRQSAIEISNRNQQSTIGMANQQSVNLQSAVGNPK
jgi:hypothetical protein